MKHTLRFVYLLFVLLFTCTLSSGQRLNSSEVLMANRVKEVQTISFKIDSGKQSDVSVLTVTRKYNSLGHESQVRLHHQNEPDVIYNYHYDPSTTFEVVADVVLDQKDSTMSDEFLPLLSSTMHLYNKDAQLVKSITYFGSSMKPHVTKYKYNQLDQLITVQYKNKGRKQAIQTYGYDEAGQLNSSVLNVFKSKDNHKGHLIYDPLIGTYIAMRDGHENLKCNKQLDEAGRVITFIFEAEEALSILGVDGMINLSEGDELKIDIEYLDSGLLKSKSQYLNNELSAFVRFQYIAKLAE